MLIKTKRWNDALQRSDGKRILVSRYRPRALLKEKETWIQWLSELAPSRKLHADFYGKEGPPIDWKEYKARYLQEMKNEISQNLIKELARQVLHGTTITLLCSSACINEKRCHRTLLKKLVEHQINKIQKQKLKDA